MRNLLNYIANYSIDTFKVSRNDSVYLVYQTQTILNNDNQNERTKSTLWIPKTKRVNYGFVPYGGNRDTGFIHTHHAEYI